MAVLTRRASVDDSAAIHRLYAAEVCSGSATYEVEVPDVAEMARRVRAGIDSGYPWRVAEIDGRIAGYAYASAYRTREGYRWTVEDSVYVDPALHGRGIGRLLLAEIVNRCTELGYRRMVAVIGDSGNVASIRLHGRLGFRIAARFPGMGFKHGRWLENVQMERALGVGDRVPPAALPLSDVD
jgi:phosphinothricin acetyltransferase